MSKVMQPEHVRYQTREAGSHNWRRLSQSSCPLLIFRWENPVPGEQACSRSSRKDLFKVKW